MNEFFCTVGGNRCTKLALYVPQRGAWYIDATLDDSPGALSGAVTSVLGSLQLKGTVRPDNSDSFVLSRSLRIVGGGDGWHKFVTQKHYHDDNGVSPLTVAQDTARECGEVLGAVDFGNAPPANSYTRRNAEGSVVLDRLLEGTGRTWWVDADGVTQIGVRPTFTPKSGSYQIDTYSPISRVATISLDDPAALWVGSVLTERVSTPQVIRDLEVHVEATLCRVYAFTGGDDSDQSRLGRAIDAILEQWFAKHLFGRYRYQVHTMASDGRANLRAVRRVSGLPDVLPVIIRPGAPGVWADLVPGSEVWVEFEAGDCGLPMVTGFAGRGEPGFKPSRLEIGCDAGDDGSPASGMGDIVELVLDPTVPFTALVGGVPTAMNVTLPTTLTGIITTGRDQIRLGRDRA